MKKQSVRGPIKRPSAVKKVVKKEEKQMTRLGSALRSLGGMGGSLVGSLIGAPGVGSSVGTGLGASLSKWLGSGDYTVQSNSLVQRFSSSGEIPMMHSTNQSVVIRHREYIGDVVSGSTAANFSVFNSYPVNPGQSQTFPWLSTIAQQFQEYTFRGLIFHYVPTSGMSVASTNTALGSVMMASNYRSTAPAYTSKVQMLNEYFSSDGRPCDSICHPIECDPKENPYQIQYVRSTAVPAGEDQKSYDLATFAVATEGLPANSVICGELWATYEVELRKPLSQGVSGVNVLSAHYQGSGGATTTPLGSSLTKVLDTIGITLSGNTITFPRGSVGTYLVNAYWANTTAVSGGGFSYSNCTAVSSFNTSTNEYLSYTSGSSGGESVTVFVNISDASKVAVVTFSNFSTLTYSGGTWVDVVVTQVNSSLT